MKILISKQKGAASSDIFNIAEKISGTDVRYDLTTTFRVIGGVLADAETIKLQYFDGDAWRDANVNGNAGVILDKDNSVKTIYGKMLDIRLTKSITAADIGVEIV